MQQDSGSTTLQDSQHQHPHSFGKSCLCGSRKLRKHYRSEKFSYVRCDDCSMLIADPMPDFNSIAKFYDQSYFQFEINNQANFLNEMELGFRDVGFDRLFPSGSATGKFLDVGCATGLLLNKMKKRGWDVCGIEICAESASYAREQFQLNIVGMPLLDCNFPDDCFDVVHLCHVMEHLPNPLDVLSEVHRIVKPGGYVILTTPNTDGVFMKYCFKGKWRSLDLHHIHLFGKRNLSRFLLKTGFKIRKQKSYGCMPPGIVHPFVKRTLDKAVKRLNLGDVMLFLLTK